MDSTLLILWNIFGMVIWCIATANSTKIFHAKLFEYLSPFWIYRNYTNLNVFGTALVCIIYNLICPIASICYWFYKLCTVGRK